VRNRYARYVRALSLIALLHPAVSSLADENRSPGHSVLQTALWKIHVLSVEANPSVSLYMSPDDKGIPARGSILGRPESNIAGEMSDLITVTGDDGKSYSFVKGVIKAGKDGVCVVVRCRVEKLAQSSQPFKVGDLVMSDETGKQRSLVAVGLGRWPIDKINPVERGPAQSALRPLCTGRLCGALAGSRPQRLQRMCRQA